MNIEQILVNSKGKFLNTFTAKKLYNASKNLDPYLVGSKSGLIVDDLETISKRIESCSSSAITATKGDKTKVLQLHRCHKKAFCPVCADNAEGQKLRKFNQLLKDNWDSVIYGYMITFTIKNGSDLFDRVDLLRDSWRKFQYLGKKGRDGEYSKFNGWHKSIEIKKEDPDIDGVVSDLWHPHQHTIVFSSSAIDYKMYDPEILLEVREYEKENGKLSPEDFKREIMQRGGCLRLEALKDGSIIPVSKVQLEWIKVTGEEGINIDVSPLWSYKDRPKDFKSLYDLDCNDSTLKSLKYSMKYSIKPEDIAHLSDQEIFDLFDLLRATRLSEIGGFLRKVPSHSKETKEEKEVRVYVEKKDKFDELKKFIFGSNIEEYMYNEKSSEYFIDEEASRSTQLYKYCLDIQKDFSISMIYEVIDYQANRVRFLKGYRAGILSSKKYVKLVKTSKVKLKESISKLRIKRDVEANLRTNGAYSRRIDRYKGEGIDLVSGMEISIRPDKEEKEVLKFRSLD